MFSVVSPYSAKLSAAVSLVIALLNVIIAPCKMATQLHTLLVTGRQRKLYLHIIIIKKKFWHVAPSGNPLLIITACTHF